MPHAHGVDASALVGSFDLLAFVVLGVLGSAAHCVGMCAPFVMLVSRRYAVPAGRHVPIAAQLWYSAGRLTTYAALGAAAGAVGGLVQFAGALVGLQRTAATLAGIVLIVSAALSLWPSVLASGPWVWVSRVSSRLHRRVPGHPFTLGLVLGLLPCGLLYSALAAAMTTGGAASGAVAMAAFGAGTYRRSWAYRWPTR
ncbi:MAG: sulfite exporter TauE/SafE family protein [Vicinamibacterales bacterium]